MKRCMVGTAIAGCAAAALFLSLLVSCAFDGPPIPDEPTLEPNSITWNGIVRTFATYTPDSLLAPAPVVLVLHGGSSSASAFWETEFAQSWKSLADSHGFLLVLPEGKLDSGDGAGHHWNDCRAAADVDNVESVSSEDDVGFIGSVIDSLAGRVSIDASRVYVTGVSNGGMMTYRLGMQLGGRFAAAAAVVANLPDPSECAFSAEPLPILIMNGTADPVMPYAGGCILDPACDRGSVRSTARTVAFWVLANGASTPGVQTSIPDTVPSDGSTITVYEFDGGASGSDVVLYRVEGGGHMAPGPGPFPATGKNRDIDAATEIWRFFEQRIHAPS